MAKKKAKTNLENTTLPIQFNIPDNIISRFATNMTVQIVENVMKLSFFEMKPEMRLDASQPLQKEVRADCVASIIISPDKFPRIIQVLQQQYDAYIKLRT